MKTRPNQSTETTAKNEQNKPSFDCCRLFTGIAESLAVQASAMVTGMSGVVTLPPEQPKRRR